MLKKRIRADLLLVKKGLAASRHQAQGLILSGKVFFREGRAEKAGQLFSEETHFRIEEPLRFVGRGGIKLESALREFQIDVEGLICIDVGASTGGFTDCLLQRGAKKVYAIDVGYGQFDWCLRQDRRVVLMERTNFRYLIREEISEPIDLAVIDVSFISLTKILPKVREFLKKGGRVVALVKPQFELSPSEVKKGVVRSDALREKALEKIKKEAEALGFEIKTVVMSPLPGPKGNQEYFLFLKR